MKPVTARLAALSTPEAGCLVWTGSVSPKGYGRLKMKREGAWRTESAHRVAYEAAHGPIPAGMVVDHICHNRRCIEPAHLRAVTNKQNLENRDPAKHPSRGVTWNAAHQAWQAKVKHHGKTLHAGEFSTEQEAVEAARLLRLEVFTHSDTTPRDAIRNIEDAERKAA